MRRGGQGDRRAGGLGGQAVIAASGSVTSGTKTTEVVLPHRGVLRVCAATTVKLTADRSLPSAARRG